MKGNRFGKIDYSSIGPRLGAAWSVNEKTVVRVGYGMHYAAGNGLTGGFCIRCQNGYSTAAGLSALRTRSRPALRWDDGFVPSSSFQAPPIISASAGNAADDIWYISPDSGKAPRFQNWSLSIQRELPWKFVAEAAYIGNRGTRLSANHSRSITSIRNFSLWETCSISGLMLRGRCGRLQSPIQISFRIGELARPWVAPCGLTRISTALSTTSTTRLAVPGMTRCS